MSKEVSPHDLGDPHQKAERLRRLRNLTNLSKKELCTQAGINLYTYVGYEAGRYTGLTKKGAEQIIKEVTRHGIYTTLEWLLYGQGEPPQVVLSQTPTTEKPEQDEKQRIVSEITLFRQHYEDAIFAQVGDDGMLPFFSVGDYVAGVNCDLSTVSTLIGSHCIAHTEQGQTLVRNLRQGRKEGYFTLCCINPETTVAQPILYDVQLTEVARIIWHRQAYQEKAPEQRRRNNEGLNENDRDE